MTLLYLIRHAHNTYIEKGRLAGRLPGVHLSEAGRLQAQALAESFAQVRLKAIYASPLERAQETALPLAHAQGLPVETAPGLNEIDVGTWQGKSLKVLRRRKLWPGVQHRPSLTRFPGGETFGEAQARIVAQIEQLRQRHPRRKDRLAFVFHSDPIKLAIAHYIGLPLDLFQRLVIAPASVSVIAVSDSGARLLQMSAAGRTAPAE